MQFVAGHSQPRLMCPCARVSCCTLLHCQSSGSVLHDPSQQAWGVSRMWYAWPGRIPVCLSLSGPGRHVRHEATWCHSGSQSARCAAASAAAATLCFPFGGGFGQCQTSSMLGSRKFRLRCCRKFSWTVFCRPRGMRRVLCQCSGARSLCWCSQVTTVPMLSIAQCCLGRRRLFQPVCAAPEAQDQSSWCYGPAALQHCTVVCLGITCSSGRWHQIT